jgi:protein disulfide-isomerase
MLKQIACLCFLTIATTLSAAIDWQTNWEGAKQQARQQNKPLLLFFTGSDWCSWCIKLEKEVLSTTEFSQAFGNKVIFVKLDFPRGKNQPSEVREQNRSLQNKYEVKGFPTVILLDSNETLLGSTGYRPGGGKAYAAHLDEILQKRK